MLHASSPVRLSNKYWAKIPTQTERERETVKKTSKAKTYKLHETIYKYIATGDIY